MGRLGPSFLRAPPQHGKVALGVRGEQQKPNQAVLWLSSKENNDSGGSFGFPEEETARKELSERKTRPFEADQIREGRNARAGELS